MTQIHKYGQFYQHKAGEIYILARSGYFDSTDHAMLISTKDGAFWNDPVEVEGQEYLNDEEFEEVCANLDREFTKIDNPIKPQP
jgi:hypothetical protein